MTAHIRAWLDEIENRRTTVIYSAGQDSTRPVAPLCAIAKYATYTCACVCVGGGGGVCPQPSVIHSIKLCMTSSHDHIPPVLMTVSHGSTRLHMTFSHEHSGTANEQMPPHSLYGAAGRPFGRLKRISSVFGPNHGCPPSGCLPEGCPFLRGLSTQQDIISRLERSSRNREQIK